MRVATQGASARVQAAPITATAAPTANELDQARALLQRSDADAVELRAALTSLLFRAEQLLYELDTARHCPITGLWIRRAWTRQARQLAATGPVTVLLLDLDGFKPINDTHGHAAGDAVLAAVAAQLDTWCTRRRGVAGRLGGDEFVAAVPAKAVTSECLGWLRAALTRPVRHDGVLLEVGVSIGAAYAAARSDLPPAEALSAALRTADAVMYAEKGGGGRRGGLRELPGR